MSTRIQLDVAPDPELVRLARLVVSGIASVTSMGLEQVEDCRAAVDEMCSTLIEAGAPDATMHLELSTDGETLEVSGRLRMQSGRAVDEVRRELSEMILSAVTDHHELDLSGDEGRFRFTKRSSTECTYGPDGQCTSERQSATGPTLSALADYNFLLGQRRRFFVGTGVGAKRWMVSRETRERLGAERAWVFGRFLVGLAF